MKLLIFGATGTVGRELVTKSLTLGHEVFAFGRSASKLQEPASANFHFIEGDVFNAVAVEAAVAGKDVVLCALGDGRKGMVRYAGTKNIVEAMSKQNVPRLICQTSLGCGDSEPLLNFFWRRIMFGWFLKKAFEDHEKQEAVIMNSNLNWTIVRPAAFTNGPATGEYRAGNIASGGKLKLKISRKDLADFMLAQLDSGKYAQQTPSLSY